jgi:hypothetical protein
MEHLDPRQLRGQGPASPARAAVRGDLDGLGAIFEDCSRLNLGFVEESKLPGGIRLAAPSKALDPQERELLLKELKVR